MNKENLIQLTTNLYRLTLLFPKKEPLRYKMREIADEILANSLRITNRYEYTNKDSLSSERRNPSKIESYARQTLEELEVLDSFFEVAKSQNWVPALETLRIQEEYSRIGIEIKKISKRVVTESDREVEAVDVKHQPPERSEGWRRANALRPSYPRDQALVNQRQERILGVLKEKGRAQVWELKQVFPEVTKRTLRRDFEQLLKKGKIERRGERNETFYQLKRVGHN